MSNVRVCVDVVGGDEKPQVVLDGIEAALAADQDIEVLAAGPAEIVNPFAASHARVEALEATDVIAMDDDPIRAVMTKRKSSIVLACRAIKKGNADAFFSAYQRSGSCHSEGTDLWFPVPHEDRQHA